MPAAFLPQCLERNVTFRSTTPCELNSPHPSPRTTRTNSLHTYARAGQTHTSTRFSASVSLMFLLRGRCGWATNSSSTVPRKTDPLSLRRTLPSVPGHFTCGPWRRRLRLTEDLLSTTPPPHSWPAGLPLLLMHLAVSSVVACVCTNVRTFSYLAGKRFDQKSNSNETNHKLESSGIQRAFV
jgi:hypothetical protein